jgi:hypothetical protein
MEMGMNIGDLYEKYDNDLVVNTTTGRLVRGSSVENISTQLCIKAECMCEGSRCPLYMQCFKL